MFSRCLAGLCISFVGLVGLVVGESVATPVQPYLRAPSLHGKSLAFTAEGDVWLASLEGGPALRLTTHPSLETNVRFSPDGRHVAFESAYQGTQQIYRISVQGGLPEPVTSEELGAALRAWTPSGQIVYSTLAPLQPDSDEVLRIIDPDTKKVDTIPLNDVQQATFADNEKILIFTRAGLGMSGDNARLYQGGAVSQLWRFHLDRNKEAVRYEFAAHVSAHTPMWGEGRLYFVSNEDGAANIWSMQVDGTDRRQHTKFSDFEVRHAQIAGTFIVYQRGADLEILDTRTDTTRQVSVHLPSDGVERQKRWIDNPMDFFSEISLAPGTDRVLITARGRIVLAGKQPQRLILLNLPADSVARHPLLSPDGRWVYTIVATEEEESIWRYPSNGSSGALALKLKPSGPLASMSLAPNGRWLAYSTEEGRLVLYDLQQHTQRNLELRDSTAGAASFRDYNWSPDSRVLAYVRTYPSRRDQVILYELESQRSSLLNSDRYESFAPAFSHDGRWIYMLSNRNFESVPKSPWGDRNTGPFFDKRAQLYAIDLRGSSRLPFQSPTELDPPSVELSPPKGSQPIKTVIERQGLQQRIYEVPIPAGNYTNLGVTEDRIYISEAQEGTGGEAVLKTFAIKPGPTKIETFVTAIRSFALSQDGKRLYFQRWKDNPGEGEIIIVPVDEKLPTDLEPHKIGVSDWRLMVDPRLEWQKMYHQAWRYLRDSFFDRRMRGVDWLELKSKYRPLLARVSDRYELDDVYRQMIAELSVLHSQVRRGDYRKDEHAPVSAHLGAILVKSGSGYRIEHIYENDPEVPSINGPLRQAGLDIQVGDRILAINGVSLAQRSPQELLLNQAGKQVLIESQKPDGRVFKRIVVPVDAKGNLLLRDRDWQRRMRLRVDAISQGTIGYIHLRAMGPQDIADFVREYYTHIDKEGLILDVRFNGGGNIDSWIIQKLLRRPWSFWSSATEPPYWNMQQAFRGHLAVLINAYTYSDGETFAAAIKALNLGPLIGQRTAGAGVWLSGRQLLADRGVVRVPETAQFALDGRWIIEGRGVDPDVHVENKPWASFQGSDSQLDAAIASLRERIAKKPLQKLVPQKIPAVGEAAGDILPPTSN